jgi:hypothetical protein
MMRSWIFGLAALAAIPLPILAKAYSMSADFTCTNPDAEISCNAGACAINTTGFTPMSLSRTGHTLSICAYSGCWEGPTLIRTIKGSVELLFAQVRPTGPAARGTLDGLSVIYDRASHSAQMHWAGFSNVMECKAAL